MSRRRGERRGGFSAESVWEVRADSNAKRGARSERFSVSFHPRLSLVGETDRFHEGLKILRTPDVARNVAAVSRDERDLDS